MRSSDTTVVSKSSSLTGRINHDSGVSVTREMVNAQFVKVEVGLTFVDNRVKIVDLYTSF